MALIEKQHKALSDEYQDLKDKLIQSKKELSRSKDVYNRKKEEWQDVIKVITYFCVPRFIELKSIVIRCSIVVRIQEGEGKGEFPPPHLHSL